MEPYCINKNDNYYNINDRTFWPVVSHVTFIKTIFEMLPCENNVFTVFGTNKLQVWKSA